MSTRLFLPVAVASLFFAGRPAPAPGQDAEVDPLMVTDLTAVPVVETTVIEEPLIEDELLPPAGEPPVPPPQPVGRQIDTMPYFSYVPGPGSVSAYSAAGQDVVRPSIVGLNHALLRERATHGSRSHRHYNLKIGLMEFSFGAGLGLEWNDNINFSDDDEESDFIFRPHVEAHGFLPVTRDNGLTLDLGLSYAFYADHSDANSSALLITPGSELSFDIRIGDAVLVNLHDRFSIQGDPVEEPFLGDTEEFTRFINTAGVAVLVDLNDLDLVIGYDHVTYKALDGDFDYLDHESDALSFSATCLYRDTMRFGLEAGGAYTRYDDSATQTDTTSYHVGVFADSQLSNYLRLRLAVGYQGMSFEDSAEDVDDYDGWYANASLVHRLNSRMVHTLSVGREAQSGTFANYRDSVYVRHTAAYSLVKDVVLGTELFYENGDENGGPFSEHFQRYGGRLSVGYSLNRHATVSARYQFLAKDSDEPHRDYRQNSVILDFSYQF